MKVSILVPVYGVERYIEACVRSLMEQTYNDIEYVFVNDCTPDGSVKILREVISQYPDRSHQVHIIEHQHNQGLGGARLTALSNATSDAVMSVDSDDYIHPQAIELLVDKMKRTDADIVDGGFSIVRNGAVTKRHVPPHVSTPSYLKTILCQDVEPNRIWGRLIKRSLFTDHDITFYRGIDYCEDYSVLPRLLLYAQREWVDQSLYCYRDDNPDSYTNNITPRNAVSFLKAQQVVASWFVQDKSWTDYRTAAEIGWVNIWRFARRFNIDSAVVEEHFKMSPSLPITKKLTSIMKSPMIPYKISNICYLAARRLYLSLLR